jgi:hypothetical protein
MGLGPTSTVGDTDMEKPGATMRNVDHSSPTGALTVDADLRPLIFALREIAAAVNERKGTVIELESPEVQVAHCFPHLPDDLKPTVNVEVKPAETSAVVNVSAPAVAVDLSAIKPLVWVMIVSQVLLAAGLIIFSMKL